MLFNLLLTILVSIAASLVSDVTGMSNKYNHGCFGDHPYAVQDCQYVDDYYSHDYLYNSMGYHEIEANVTESLCGIYCGILGSSIPGDNQRSKKASKEGRGYIYHDDRLHCAQAHTGGLACGFGQPAWKRGVITAGWKEEYACAFDEYWSLLADGYVTQDYGQASPAQCIGVCESVGNYTRALISAESVCVCGNEFSREPMLVNVTEVCDRACPGDYSTHCGGSEGSRVFKKIE